MQFLDNSFHLWRIWRANARASVTREMAFRGNFILSIIRQLLWAGAFLFLIEIIFQNTDALGGWSKPEILIILALSRIVEGIMDTMFSRNIADFPTQINEGKFDFNLLKPGPAQFHTAFKRLHIHNIIGGIASGLAILAYAIVQIDPLPGLVSWITFIVLVSLAITIFYSLLILVASLAFFLERLQTMWSFINLFTEPLTAPFNIFPRKVEVSLTFILPLAFVVFVPAQTITGHPEPWHLPVAILVTIVFLTLANLAWAAGLRRYSSASS